MKAALILLSSLQLAEAHSVNILLREIRRYKDMLFPHLSPSSEREYHGAHNLTIDDERLDVGASEGALKITLHVLNELGHRELANKLEKCKYEKQYKGPR